MYKFDTYSSFFDVHGSKFHWAFILKYIIPGSCSTSSWSKANLLQCKRSNKRAVFWCCFDNWSPIEQSQQWNTRRGHWCDIQHCSIQLESAQQQVAAVLAKGGEIYLALVKKDMCCREFRFNFTIKPYAIKSNVFQISYARIIIAYLYEINWDRAGHISGQRFTYLKWISMCLLCESAVKQVLEARQEAYREAKSLGSQETMLVVNREHNLAHLHLHDVLWKRSPCNLIW